MAHEYTVYIATRIAQAKQNSSRILLVGFDKPTLDDVLGDSGLDGGDFKFASSHPQLAGKTILYSGHKVHFEPLGYAEEYAPELVLVMPSPDQNTPALYETLLRMLDITAANVLLPIQYWSDRLEDQDETPDRLVAQIPDHIKGGLTSREIYIHLYECLREIATRKIPGDIINLGVYQGWSMYFIGLAMERLGLTDRKLVGFDTFAGFVPSDSLLDNYVHGSALGNEAYQDVALPQIEANLSRFPFIELIQGDIRETIMQLDQRPLALALFDMDDYTPTALAINVVYDNLSPLGMMVHDHYAHHTLIYGNCIGQRMAVREFLARHSMFSLRGTNVMIKT